VRSLVHLLARVVIDATMLIYKLVLLTLLIWKL
jgi:hypothetical protein